MHKNTFFLTAALAVFAALVVGVNIGRKVGSQSRTAIIPPSSAVGQNTPQPSAGSKTFSSRTCGISLSYPAGLQILEDASGSAMIISSENVNDSVAVTCGRDIPRPALPADRTEAKTVGEISAILYHDTGAKNGNAVDKFIFTNPKTGLDVYIAGYGMNFNEVIRTLQVP